jgi:hypothetical protein
VTDAGTNEEREAENSSPYRSLPGCFIVMNIHRPIRPGYLPSIAWRLPLKVAEDYAIRSLSDLSNPVEICSQNSDAKIRDQSGGETFVTVMQAIDLRNGDDSADAGWQDGARFRAIFVEREMGARLVVVVDIC